MSTAVIIHDVTYSSEELPLRLSQRWRFISFDAGKVLVLGEPIARFDKRGARVRLSPLGPRELVRWLGWAIQEICPGAQAEDAEQLDAEGKPTPIGEAPLAEEEVVSKVQEIIDARKAAIAKEADPSGGAHEAVALVTYLVERGLLELCGPTAAVARAVVPLLAKREDDIGAKLEDLLLDLDEVDELYADADQMGKIIGLNAHVLDLPPP